MAEKKKLNTSICSQSFSRIRSHSLYNIQDYLPDSEQPPLKQSTIIKIKTQQPESQHKLAQLKEQIAKLRQQNQQHLSTIHEQSNKINEQSNLLNQQKSRQNQLLQQLERVKKHHKRQTQQLSQTLQKHLKKEEKRKNNLHIYCQKYQQTIQPLMKHSYTIQVQTQEIVNLATSRVKPTKPNFYELYQEKLQHSRATSVKKPKKPQLFTTDKQNQVKKLNERIEGKKQWKYKIKDEQIQLYPIAPDQLNTVIEGILKMA